MKFGRALVQSEILDGFRRSAEGIALRLQPQGILQRRLAALCEERVVGDVREAVQFQQAVLRIALRFGRAAAPQMNRRNSARGKRRANQQKTVTVQRVFLRAHQRGRLLPAKRQHSLAIFEEIGSSPARGVIHLPIRQVILRIVGPAAEPLAQVFVANLRGGQLRFQRLPVELRKTKTTGTAAHIAKNGNIVAHQRAKKISQFKVRMPDSEQAASGMGSGGHGVRSWKDKLYRVPRAEARAARRIEFYLCWRAGTFVPASPESRAIVKENPATVAIPLVGLHRAMDFRDDQHLAPTLQTRSLRGHSLPRAARARAISARPTAPGSARCRWFRHCGPWKTAQHGPWLRAKFSASG